MTARLIHYKATSGNVGDDFSEWLFSRMLGDQLDPDAETMLYGVGSILDASFDKSFRKDASVRRMVFGSGARKPQSLPDMTEGKWDIYCVRGPLTARALGLPASKAVADPAILAPLLLPATVNREGPVGIVPYYTASQELWDRIAARLGWQVISPRQSVEDFVAALTKCSRVFCESMHGAIFADAYRIPWRPVSGTGAASEKATHAFKWTDWVSSMGLGFDTIQIVNLNQHQRRGALGALSQAAKVLHVANKLKKADVRDRFLLSNDAVLKGHQDHLQALMDDLRRDMAN